MLKEDIRDDLDEKLAKAKKWRNLTFLKNGRSALGLLIHPSESAALQVAIRWERRVLSGYYKTFDLGGAIPETPVDEYSHTIQIPVA